MNSTGTTSGAGSSGSAKRSGLRGIRPKAGWKRCSPSVSGLIRSSDEVTDRRDRKDRGPAPELAHLPHGSEPQPEHTRNLYVSSDDVRRPPDRARDADTGGEHPSRARRELPSHDDGDVQAGERSEQIHRRQAVL